VKIDPIGPQRYGLTLCVTERGRKARRACPKSAVIAEIENDIVFNADILDTYDYEGWKPIHHDLLVVSAAVEFADRRCARRISGWSRDFRVIVPVYALATWRRKEVRESLCAALRQLTGDHWEFEFVQWEGGTHNGSRQRSLPFGNNKKFAIAYSDGLDSRCVSSLCDDGDAAVCVRVAKNRQRLKKGDRPFDQIPFRVNVPNSRESSVRSRGFKFAAITAIAAQLSRLGKIVVPESGQGALGPVLLPLHNIYADYRNHPTYFRKMERFIKALLGYDVKYEQPRLWSTKGQTISAYLGTPGNTEADLLDTRSCWQQRWNAKLGGKLRQCGICAACLLRRMSMHAAGIKEPADTYVISDLTVPQFAEAVPKSNALRRSHTLVEYGSVGTRHMQHLADMAEWPDDQLAEHAFEIARVIGTTEMEALENLRKLLVSHAHEWRAFLTAQGEESFLKSWTEGGCYGRSE